MNVYCMHAGYHKLKILIRLEQVLLWRQIGEMRTLTCNILLTVWLPFFVLSSIRLIYLHFVILIVHIMNNEHVYLPDKAARRTKRQIYIVEQHSVIMQSHSDIVFKRPAKRF